MTPLPISSILSTNGNRWGVEKLRNCSKNTYQKLFEFTLPEVHSIALKSQVPLRSNIVKKLTRMTYYAVFGIQNKDKTIEWIPCFSWWSPWMMKSIYLKYTTSAYLSKSGTNFLRPKKSLSSPTGLQDHPRVAKIQVNVPVFSISCPWQKLCICRTSRNTSGCYFYKQLRLRLYCLHRSYIIPR